MKSKLVAILVFIILLPNMLSGQKTEQASLNGKIFGTLDMDTGNVLSFEPISGATITIYSPADTLSSISNEGTFRFPKLTPGEVTLEIRHLGYETQVLPMEIKPGSNDIMIQLKEAVSNIDQVVVKADVLIVTMKGDTLVYNPAAVRTLEGDEAIEILKSLPGVEIKGDVITVMGEPIARSYVDGKLIFGDAPMDVFRHLPAEDVERIRVYDEYTDRRRNAKHRRGDEKERVLDIETKSKLSRMLSADAAAEAGADLMSDNGRDSRARYSAEVDGNLFSEKWQVKVRAGTMNTDNFSNSYRERTWAGTFVNHAWETRNGERGNLMFGYDFDSYTDRSRTINTRDYFATDQFAKREERDTLSSRGKTRSHRNTVRLNVPGFLKGSISFTHNLSYSDSGTNSTGYYFSAIDDIAPSVRNSHNDRNGKIYDISESISWSIRSDKGTSFRVSGSARFSKNEGGEVRRDETNSTPVTEVINISSERPGSSYSAWAMFMIHLPKMEGSFFDISYRFDYTDIHNRQAAVDISDILNPVADNINTYDYTNRDYTHSLRSTFVLGIDRHRGLDIFADLQSSRILRDERLPSESRYSSPFTAVLPSVRYHKQKGMLARFAASYTTSRNLPSVEQLRPWLDNTNRQFLVAGNPGLKQSYTHNLSVSDISMFGQANNTLETSINASYTRNPIISNTTFFVGETYLPEWDYTAPAQSSLMRFENTGHMWHVSGNVSFIRPVKALKSMLKSRLGYTYSDTPSYIAGQLERTRTSAPSLGLELSSNFSAKIKLELNSHTSYRYSRSPMGEESYIRESLSFNWNLRNIYKTLFFRGNYGLTFDHHFTDRPAYPARHILNAGVGLNFNKNKGSISFNIYDVLNGNSGYKLNMYADHIMQSWNYSFGRFFTIGVSYKFKASN